MEALKKGAAWVVLALTFGATLWELYIREPMGAVGGALLFLFTLWVMTFVRTEDLAAVVAQLNEQVKEWAGVVQIMSDMAGLERSIQTIARQAQKTPILRDYLKWLHYRYAKVLELPSSDGVITAPDPDYFGFAAIFLGKARKSVRSTSLVDPHWYDSNECVKYIQDQVKDLINKGTTYKRYFIVNPTHDTSERKTKTVSVIRDQAQEGFVVAVVHTTNYESEIDAAVIDDNLLWVRAVVPNQDHLALPGVITGCACYFRHDRANTSALAQLQGYFVRLDTRVHRIFRKTDASASIDQQAVYG